MKKMTSYRPLWLFAISLMFFSCSPAGDKEINEDLVERISDLIEAEKEADMEKKQELLKGFDPKSKFSLDMAKVAKDQEVLNKSEKLLQDGDLDQALELINSRIVERGPTPELSQSKKKLTIAQDMLSFDSHFPFQDAIESRIRFEKIKIQGRRYFNKEAFFQKWLSTRLQKVNRQKKQESAHILSSMMLHYDLARITKPEILTTLEAQINTLTKNNSLAEARKNLREGKKSFSPIQDIFAMDEELQFSKKLSKKQKTFLDQASAFYSDDLLKMRIMFKSGDPISATEAFFELNETIYIADKQIQSVLKDLYKNKKLKKTKSLKQPFFDISSLTETIEKVN